MFAPRHLALSLILPFALVSTSTSAETSARPAVSPAVAAAVASKDRPVGQNARDVYRNPAETLTFFGVRPGSTILEYSPGGSGWYTEILAPLTRAGGGSLLLGQATGAGYDQLQQRINGAPALFGHVRMLAWPPADTDLPVGTVDTVLTFRNVHNMLMRDTAEAEFARFFKVLKPGGVLGVVEHRLPENRDPALEKTSGYVKISTVRKLAEDAGFVFEAQSEINANPKDSADWPKGVWTLPPTLRLGDVDRERYLAIGESDRMTLRFRKPPA